MIFIIGFITVLIIICICMLINAPSGKEQSGNFRITQRADNEYRPEWQDSLGNWNSFYSNDPVGGSIPCIVNKKVKAKEIINEQKQKFIHEIQKQNRTWEPI